MQKITFFREVVLLLILFLFTSQVNAQISNYISDVKIGPAKDKQPLTISADLISPEGISSINIAIRSFGQNEFQYFEMLIAGTSASSTIPAEFIQPPFIEYYLMISLKDGSTQTYPLSIEEGVSPLQITVEGISAKDNEILVLTPSDGAIMSSEELLITVSFIKAPDKVDVASTKVYLNNQDITHYALLTEDLIIITGDNIENLPTGAGLLNIEIFENDGSKYHTITRNFQIVTPAVAAAIASKWSHQGTLRAEARNENYNSRANDYLNFSADVKASYEDWNMNGYLYVTSEEKNNLQPYNRFSAAIQNGDWLDLRLGDSYPRFPNLIMDGKRIRGVSGSLNLGTFNIQSAFGETDRKIEGSLLEVYSRDNAPLRSDVIAINEFKYSGPFGRVNLGTFKRQIFALRPSFGSGRNFQWGLTYLHAKDDPGSIEFGARPMENIVLGTDMSFSLDDKNIQFTSQAAFSLFNKDISGGSLTDTQIDSIFGSGLYSDVDPSDVKNLKNILGKFITVNEFIGPLNPQEFASLAAEAAVTFNYFNNTLRASYIYRGNDYLSLGQSFIRTDVKGINIVDRIRLLDNKLFVSLGYEMLEDNLQQTKIATTKYQTLSASVSIFPRINFPNITLGYNKYDNNNSINVNDPVNGRFTVDDITDRFLVQLSYDVFLYVRHSTSFSFSTQKREDNSFAKADATFNSGTFSVNSFWTPQLSSTFQMIYSSSEIAAQPFDYFTLYAAARYRMLENKLLLSASISPSFGDFERQVLEFLADYNLIANLNLGFQARIFRFPGKFTNSIIGLTSRFTF